MLGYPPFYSEQRLHGIESLEKFTKCFHEEDDVYRCIYREEWRTKKEKMLVDEIERSGIFRKSEVLKQMTTRTRKEASSASPSV